MANEIYISAVTGLTLTLQLYSGLTPVGVPFAATEIPPSTGSYTASMPTTPYGYYIIVGFAAPNITIGSCAIFWDGDYEMPIGLSMLQGLDPNNPMTVTPAVRDTGDIGLAITGDGQTSSTVTRTS